MANVLGELFSNIANSIRNGLEDIGTMKPIEFPDRVAEICSLLEHYKNNSGGGEGGEGSTLPANVETGTFNTADTGIGRVYINHTLGEVPDFVMIYLTSLGDGIDPNDNQMVSVWSVKEDLYSSFIKGGQNCTDGTSVQTLGHDVAASDSYMDDYFARIYCPDDHTIRVGTDSEIDNGQVKHFFANSKYQWVAVSGLRNAVADPVVEPLAITENGTYTAPEGVDGYNPVTVDIPDPTKNFILKEQDISGFSLSDQFGYSTIDHEPTYSIEEGEEYYVIWDGETYKTTAMKADSFMTGALFMGNGTKLGLPSNNEPFAIGYVNGMVMYVAFDDPKESHKIGVYQSTIRLQDKTITENGEYTADEGFYGLGKVLVQLASSGGGNVKIVTGTLDAEKTSRFTIDHNLGAVPDFFYIVNKTTAMNYCIFAEGISSKLQDKIGTNVIRNQYIYYSSAGRYYWQASESPIDNTVGGVIYMATEKSLSVTAISSEKWQAGSTWVAIGGLVESE